MANGLLRLLTVYFEFNHRSLQFVCLMFSHVQTDIWIKSGSSNVAMYCTDYA